VYQIYTFAVRYPLEKASFVEGWKSVYETLRSFFFDNSSRPPLFICLPPTTLSLSEHLENVKKYIISELYIKRNVLLHTVKISTMFSAVKN
jgi:hypothetical protein